MRFNVSAPRTERGLNARFWPLTGLQEFAISLPIAVTIVHMTERDLGLGIIGLAFSLRALIVVALEVPTGGLADALGRKPIALVSQVFTLLSLVALLFVASPPLLIAYAILQGVGAALSSGALDAWYVDTLKRVAPESSLQKNLAAIEMVRSTAFLLGMGLGGALPGWVSAWNLPWPLAGFGVSLFLGIVFRAVVWAMTVALVDEPEYRSRSAAAGFRAVPEVLRDAAGLVRRLPVVPYLLLSVAAGGFALIAVETFWQPLAVETLGASVENSAIFGVFGALTGGALLFGSFVVLQGAGRLWWASSAALAGVMQLLKGLAILLVGLSASGIEMGLGLALAYMAIAGNNIPHDTILNQAVPDNRRSVMLSVNSLSLWLGIMLGSFFLGLLAEAAGPGTALWVAGGVTAAASLSYVGVARALRRTPQQGVVLEGVERAPN
jgi:MFS family permease